MSTLRFGDPAAFPISCAHAGGAIGPFASHTAAGELTELLRSRTDLTVATAREVFEGTRCGDAIFVVDEMALEFGMHPFVELDDFSVYDDNGHLVAYPRRGRRFLPADAIVLLQHAWQGERRARLPDPLPAPARLDVDDRERCFCGEPAPHPGGGYLDVVEDVSAGDPAFYVTWRRDRRKRADLRVISRHSREEFARDRLPEAMESFTPAPRELEARMRRNRDIQRHLVYAFETRVARLCQYVDLPMPTIEACQDLLAGVYEDANLGNPPEIRIGREGLMSSYFRELTGITMARGQMERWVVLHEAAHHLTRKVRDEPGHGPSFVGVLVALLERHCGIDPTSADELISSMGLEVNNELRAKLLDRMAPAAAPTL